LKRDLEIRQDLVGDSAVMTELGRQIAQVAPTDATLLIQGESGTGKELVAHAVHRNSKRASGPFVAINCGAIPENLLESELFGHEKGAFTGALVQKMGKFEAASGGTLFLDEIAELPPSIQVKLLRVLEQREIERLGGTRPIKVNIRLIAATHRDLEAAVAEGKFRHDLFFRLKVVTIETPPLRERAEDILHLARHFVARFNREMARGIRGISPEAERMLTNYHWPGNVRELRNIIERAIVVGAADTVTPADLPPELSRSGNNGHGRELFNLEEVRSAAERDAIQRAFARTKGKSKEAAVLLGLNRTHLYVKANKLGLTHLQKTRQSAERLPPS
jgi:DNA-binding NtrC family response regulator